MKFSLFIDKSKAEEIANVVYAFRSDIQQEIDDQFPTIKELIDYNTCHWQIDRLFDEGINYSNSKPNHPVKRWWDENVKIYQSIKLWLMFYFPRKYNIPNEIADLILNYLPWVRNVVFDDTFLFLLDYIKRLEREIGKTL